MKIFILLIILSAMANAKELTVFILAGQSNMSGYGRIKELPQIAPELVAAMLPSNVRIYSSVDGNVQEESTLQARGPHMEVWTKCFSPNAETYANGFPYFGPELSFGKGAATAFPNDDILILKYSYGGTPICDDPNLLKAINFPKELSWKSRGDGSLYKIMMEGITNSDGSQITGKFYGLKNLINKEKNSKKYTKIKLSGLVWMQGESDAIAVAKDDKLQDIHLTPICANAYRANFEILLNSIRSDLSAPNLSFVVGLISTQWGYQQIVRNALYDASSTISGGNSIDASDLLRYDVDAKCHYSTGESNAHYDTQAQVKLGSRFIDVFQKKVARAGNDINYLLP